MWEVDFQEAKSKNDKQTPPNFTVATPTPSHSTVVAAHHVPTELEFLYPVLLETGKVGLEVCAL